MGVLCVTVFTLPAKSWDITRGITHERLYSLVEGDYLHISVGFKELQELSGTKLLERVNWSFKRWTGGALTLTRTRERLLGGGNGVMKGKDLGANEACTCHSSNGLGVKHQFGFVLWWLGASEKHWAEGVSGCGSWAGSSLKAERDQEAVLTGRLLWKYINPLVHLPTVLSFPVFLSYNWWIVLYKLKVSGVDLTYILHEMMITVSLMNIYGLIKRCKIKEIFPSDKNSGFAFHRFCVWHAAVLCVWVAGYGPNPHSSKFVHLLPLSNPLSPTPNSWNHISDPFFYMSLFLCVCFWSIIDLQRC